MSLIICTLPECQTTAGCKCPQRVSCFNLKTSGDVWREQQDKLLCNIARRMADDYQTSEAHHPDQVLVPRDAFEAMLSAIGRTASHATSGTAVIQNHPDLPMAPANGRVQ